MATTSTAQDRTKTPRGSMNPQLHKAAREGDIALLTSLMGGNSPPDLTSSLTPRGNTVLHIAVKFGHEGIVEEIIKQTQWSSLISQSNSKDDTPLHIAARAGHLGLIKLLTPTLEEGASWRKDARVAWETSNLEGSTAIHEALKKGHGEVASRLLSFEEKHELALRANKAKESPLYLAAEAGLSRVVKEIMDRNDFSIEGPDGQNPLHIAVIKGRLEVVKVLLESDRAEEFMIKEEDSFEKTALHYASTIGYYGEVETEVETRTEILTLLLKANPSLAYVPDKNGDYPLLIATTRGPFEVVKIILEHCPDSAELVNEKEQNALHLAVIRKSEAVLQYLINRPEFKKMINEPDDDGNTPVHLATVTSSNEIVDLLSNCEGVDLAVTNNQGLTAMDLCGYKAEQQMIRDTLKKFGAVPSRHKWQELLFLPLHPPPPPLVPPRPVPTILVSISSNLKSATKTLPIVTTLIATVTFAAAFTVPGGYNTNAPDEGMPVFIRKAALKAFVFSDTLAFCSSMAATILLVYASACSNDEFLISSALKTSSYIAGVSVLATITAFMTGVYVLMQNESLWLAIIAISLGCAVPIFLIGYSEWLEAQRKALKKQKSKSFPIH